MGTTKYYQTKEKLDALNKDISDNNSTIAKLREEIDFLSHQNEKLKKSVNTQTNKVNKTKEIYKKEGVHMFFFFENEEHNFSNEPYDETNITIPSGVNYSEDVFESIRHINEYGQEFWYARELYKVLDYTEFNKFLPVIKKAMKACEQSGQSVSDHFAHVSEMVSIGSGAIREFDSYQLSRYACYLIVQNGDARKKIIALGQTYFAIKTRQQELMDEYQKLDEDKKRLSIRTELKTHNKSLAEAANMAGITDPRDYAVFQNKGYQGLYGGLSQKEIHERKGLKKSQQILDYMGSTELAANLFRATQTDEKIRRENIVGKEAANQTHYEVGKKVRQTIAELGGTMPEDLPTPSKSIKQIEREQKHLNGE